MREEGDGVPRSRVRSSFEVEGLAGGDGVIGVCGLVGGEMGAVVSAKSAGAAISRSSTLCVSIFGAFLLPPFGRRVDAFLCLHYGCFIQDMLRGFRLLVGYGFEMGWLSQRRPGV